MPVALGEGPVALGEAFPECNTREEPPANPLTGKSPSPSVKNRALGEGFAECRVGTRGRLDAVGRRPTPFFFYFLPRVQHSGKIFEFFFKYSLPSAAVQALGEEICFFLNPSSPSATAQALGEATSKFFLFFSFSM